MHAMPIDPSSSPDMAAQADVAGLFAADALLDESLDHEGDFMKGCLIASAAGLVIWGAIAAAVATL